ncbi:ABC transporter permease [Planobispora rosea]|uniref:ABC transporter permease n=1 Tax=Planobispora rosea TaxID=35762 RepID=A0A8J3S221_PLARO|nr:iron ABC transporter permease [Planobispora rosea]GGS58189.1 ABC transporter permease [Planobispora rosea]GIH84790.1 ABC transporter permease [Planobispora rosea]
MALRRVPVIPGRTAAGRARPGTAARRIPAGLLAPAGVTAALALLPVGYLAVRSAEAGADAVARTLLRSRTLELAARSLGLAAVVTVLCVAVGVTLAWLVVRSDLPGRRFFGVLAALPLAVPSYVAAYTWVAATGVEGFGGSVLVLTLCSYPYVYLPVAAALRRMDPAMEEVALSLGRGRRGVVLRQLRPSAAAGGLLVAMYVLAEFGAVAIMRFDVFTTQIYTSYRSGFSRTPAAVLGLLLVAITLVIVVAESRTRGRAGYATRGAPARRPPAVRLGVAARAGALAWSAALAGLAVGFPLAGIGYWLADGSSAGADAARLAEAVAATLGVAAAGAVLTTALAVPVGIIAARYRGRTATLLEQSTYVGHSLPGIVMALSLVFFAVRYLPAVYQRWPLLVIAYAVLFMPAAVGAVRASVLQSPPVLEEVARSLGRGPLRAVGEVTLPLALPGVLAGAALVFLTAMKELPATLLLRPTGMDTLATRLWTETGSGAYGAAAPYAALLMLLAAVPGFVLGRRSLEEVP